MKIAKVQEMKNLDRRAVIEFGIPEILLMENAGNAVFFAIQNEIGVKGKKFLIICGSGNNGGDGMVVARKLHSNGGFVTLILLSDEEKLSGITKENYEIASRIGIEILKTPSIKEIGNIIKESDVIVDGILGTGLSGKVKGIYKEVIQLLNNSTKRVVSIDIPSGINGDTGEIMGVAVKSNWTVTFGLPKIGNIEYPGFEYCGKLFISHISFPPSLYEDNSLKVSINEPILLPRREKDTHKGSFGKVLFIAGSRNYLGAPYFAALSFLKAGGGLSYLATPKSISSFIANRGSEIVLIPGEETRSGSIAINNLDELLEFSEKVDFVVVGPGLSLDEETKELVLQLTQMIEKPLLLDGDGITAIKGHLDIVKDRNNPTILTPHPVEFGRLINKGTDEIKKNRIDIVQSAAKVFDCILVLKGAHSLIGYPDGGAFINMTGNPGMATAGSGDVLTGTIAALYGILHNAKEKMAVDKAVRLGVLIHGLAGDLASTEIGEDGVIAGDILRFLPEAMDIYRNNPEEIDIIPEVI
jgi:NAD(P)H-hydrate epimerase